MKINNPFDRMLDNYKGHIPESVRDAAIYVTDTLDLAWAAAQSVFEEEAKPEHALKILELFLLEKNNRETRDQETNDI